jgi:hypothetical protein
MVTKSPLTSLNRTDADGYRPLVEAKSPGGVIVVSASFVRPADTTAYAVNDLVGANTAVNAANATEIQNAVGDAGDAIRIEKLRLRKTSIGLTNAQFRVHLFRGLPTFTVGDNGAFGALTALAATDLSLHVGYFDVTMDRASATVGGGAYGVGLPPAGSGNYVSPASGTSLWYAVQALAAYAPANAETFSVHLEGIRP